MSDTISVKGPLGPPRNQTAAARAAGAPLSDASGGERLKQACADFEAIFVDFMLQQMRQTVPQNDSFGGGRAEQLYTSMMDSELAKSIAHQRGLGLAEQMYRQLMAATNRKESEEP